MTGENSGLSSMWYGSFEWPHNPKIYSIEYERVVATHKVPFGDYVLQDLGRTRRVMRGEGEFVGESAYSQFGQLANRFYQGGTDWLIHPIWQPAPAFFVDLKLEQMPRYNYVKYSFTFWEDIELEDKGILLLDTSGDSGSEGSGSGGSSVYIVKSGDCMWNIAKSYGMSLADLIALNPQIKNPNLIYPGNEVYVS